MKINRTQKDARPKTNREIQPPLTVASLDQAKQSLYLSLAAASSLLPGLTAERTLWLLLWVALCRFCVFGGGEGAAVRKKEHSSKSRASRVTTVERVESHPQRAEAWIFGSWQLAFRAGSATRTRHNDEIAQAYMHTRTCMHTLACH